MSYGSSHVGSINLTLSFEIDEKAGQEELNYFGYGYTKDGRCMSLPDPSKPNEERKRVGRFPSQQAYEQFGMALENYIFYLLKTQYNMTPHTNNDNNNNNDDNEDEDDIDVDIETNTNEKETKSNDKTNNNDNNSNENTSTTTNKDNKDTKDETSQNEAKSNEKDSKDTKDNNDKTETDSNDKESKASESNENDSKNDENNDKPQNKNKYVSDDDEDDNNNDKDSKKKSYASILKGKLKGKNNDKDDGKPKMNIRPPPRTIFTSPDYKTKETLLLLVPGSGAVRSGQWARSVCINDNLASGTMFPFIDEAYQRNWGVILFDPNGKDFNSNGSSKYTMFSDGHVIQGYNQFVAPLIYDEDNRKIRNLLIVCHSAGGGATSRLLGGSPERSDAEFAVLDNVLAAGTDTWFIQPPRGKNNRNPVYEQIYQRNIVNWKTSTKRGDSMLQNSNNPYKQKRRSNNWAEEQRSCGHTAHEYSSPACIGYIFKFFDARLGIPKKTLNNQVSNVSNESNEKTQTDKQLNDDDKSKDTKNKMEVENGENDKLETEKDDGVCIEEKANENNDNQNEKEKIETDDADKVVEDVKDTKDETNGVSENDGNKMEVDEDNNVNESTNETADNTGGTDNKGKDEDNDTEMN